MCHNTSLPQAHPHGKFVHATMTGRLTGREDVYESLS